MIAVKDCGHAELAQQKQGTNLSDAAFPAIHNFSQTCSGVFALIEMFFLTLLAT